jgi:hypothetical protein
MHIMYARLLDETPPGGRMTDGTDLFFLPQIANYFFEKENRRPLFFCCWTPDLK